MSITRVGLHIILCRSADTVRLYGTTRHGFGGIRNTAPGPPWRLLFLYARARKHRFITGQFNTVVTCIIFLCVEETYFFFPHNINVIHVYPALLLSLLCHNSHARTTGGTHADFSRIILIGIVIQVCRYIHFKWALGCRK